MNERLSVADGATWAERGVALVAPATVFVAFQRPMPVRTLTFEHECRAGWSVEGKVLRTHASSVRGSLIDYDAETRSWTWHPPVIDPWPEQTDG